MMLMMGLVGDDAEVYRRWTRHRQRQTSQMSQWTCRASFTINNTIHYTMNLYSAQAQQFLVRRSVEISKEQRGSV